MNAIVSFDVLLILFEINQQNLKNLIKEKQDHDEKLIWIFMIHRLMKKTMMQMMKVQERLPTIKIRIHRKRKNKML